MAIIKADPDKALNIDGKRVFPVGVFMLCEPWAEGQSWSIEDGATSISKNPDFDFNIISAFITGNTTDYTLQDNRHIFHTFESDQVHTGVISAVRSAGLDKAPYFLGYYSDEPDFAKIPVSTLIQRYNDLHSYDPNHLVIVNLCCSTSFKTWVNTADVLMFDQYPIRDGFMNNWGGDPAYTFVRADFLYAWESITKENVMPDFNNINEVTKPVWMVIQALGIDETPTGVRTPTLQEIKAQTYTALTLDIKGIIFYSYKNYMPGVPNNTTGYVHDPAKTMYMNQLARELKSLNDILLAPTTAFCWHYKQDYTTVKFSPNPTKFVRNETRRTFNYLLKYYNNKIYLIIVNKDSSPMQNITITIAGLSGTMNAKTLGLETTGSQRAGRVLTVNNGVFIDSFDSQAAHIYEITSAQIPCPTPSGTFAISGV